MRAIGSVVFGTASRRGSAGRVRAESVAPKVSASGRKGFLPITVGKNLFRWGSLAPSGFELIRFSLVLHGGLGE
eukprot:14177900-Alexandrium_andersonii.AAC.1